MPRCPLHMYFHNFAISKLNSIGLCGLSQESTDRDFEAYFWGPQNPLKGVLRTHMPSVEIFLSPYLYDSLKALKMRGGVFASYLEWSFEG